MSEVCHSIVRRVDVSIVLPAPSVNRIRRPEESRPPQQQHSATAGLWVLPSASGSARPSRPDKTAAKSLYVALQITIIVGFILLLNCTPSPAPSPLEWLASSSRIYAASLCPSNKVPLEVALPSAWVSPRNLGPSDERTSRTGCRAKPLLFRVYSINPKWSPPLASVSSP